jgi:transcriptional regulator with XRE-family HTH domain
MTEAGMSAKQLSLAAGLNETYVRDLLMARSINPHSDQLCKIAFVLNCEAADLLEANPRPTDLPPGTGDFVYDAEERAILYLWRMLTPPGRRRVMDSIRAAIPEHRASAA